MWLIQRPLLDGSGLGKDKYIARPQALTCQGRMWSAAAAHAKGPARPVMQSAFRAKWLW